jgi:hypothetical protein
MVAVLQHRKFPTACELIATNWRACVESSDDWSPKSKPGADGGEASGYFVTCGPINAYAKPSALDATPLPVPRAAHEKIACDLAQDLGLPVAPAILKRWATPPEGNQPCVAFVLMPFFPVHKWDLVKAVPGLETTLKYELRFAASSMVAFDTWIGNTDRQNGGNLLVNRTTTAAPGSPPHAAYLDFSYSLSYAWRPDFRTVTPVGVYPTETKDIDPVTVEGVIGAIEVFSAESIHSIVTRIPDDFLAPAAKSVIADGLLYRQTKIRDALKPILEAKP